MTNRGIGLAYFPPVTQSARKRRNMRKRMEVSPRVARYLESFQASPPVKDFRTKREARTDGTTRKSFGKPRKRIGGAWRD
jgi:hypothetical protein